jgi:hypothetical protein
MRFAEILQKLDETLEFCNSLGLSGIVKESRFVQYRQHIDSLVQILASRRPGESLPTDVHEQLRTNHLRYVISLTESFELVLTLPYLKTVDPKIARQKLKKVLAGPFLPTDEDQNSNEARNLLFELNLASKLAATGLEPKIGESADIEVVVQEKQLLIECKRPLTQSGVIKCIKDARDQINSRLQKKPPGSRGVIALSMSKAFNPEHNFLLYSEESSAKELLGERLEVEAHRLNETWSNLGEKGNRRSSLCDHRFSRR